MPRSGPRARPAHLQVVEGNPSKKSAEELDSGLKVAPGAPPEPEWSEWFPDAEPRPWLVAEVPRRASVEAVLEWVDADGARALAALRVEQAKGKPRPKVVAALEGLVDSENRWAREKASEEWRRVVAILDRHGVLTELDLAVLSAYCVAFVRVMQCERDVSRNGLRQRGERGWQRNGSIISAKAYFDEVKYCAGVLGLSPVDRNHFKPEGDPDGDDGPFDL